MPTPEAAPQNISLTGDHTHRITLPVYITGKGPYAFLIDTGAQRTIVSEELASTLALPAGKEVRIITLSGPARLPTALISHLHYGKGEMRDVVSPLISEANLGGQGILGLDGLQGKRLVLDFAARVMAIEESAGRSDQDIDEDGTIIVRGRNRMGHLILVNCRVGGENTKVILDTGAQYSIGNMALLRKLRADRMTMNPQPVTLVSVVGEEVTTQMAVVKSVTVGGVVLRDLPIIFTDAAPFNQLGLADKPAMLLGMQILRLFDRVTIDFAQKQVDFTLPKAALREARR